MAYCRDNHQDSRARVVMYQRGEVASDGFGQSTNCFAPIPLIFASVKSAVKLGLFTLLMLVALALLASILFSFSAIGVQLFT